MAIISLSRVFGLLTTALPSYLDDNFNTIISLLNGNLDETNVKKSADSILGGGFSINATPTANSIPVLNSSGQLPLSVYSFRGALVTKSAAQSIANNTLIAASFDASSYDTDTMHNNVTNNSRITIPTGITKAKFSVLISWATNTTGWREVILYKNGVSTAGGFDNILYPDPTTGYCTVPGISAILPCVAGDYFECFVRQTSGGALNIAASPTISYFAVELIN